jgi:hypothetical protein
VNAKMVFTGWGEIVRDAKGEPTGVFKEQTQSVISAVVPKPSHEEMRAALRRGIARAASLGITSIQNAHGIPEEVDLADVPRFVKIGVLASMMPIHADPDTIGAWTAASAPKLHTLRPELTVFDGRVVFEAR